MLHFVREERTMPRMGVRAMNDFSLASLLLLLICLGCFASIVRYDSLKICTLKADWPKRHFLFKSSKIKVWAGLVEKANCATGMQQFQIAP
jgi:hypothetical protein